MYPAFVPHACTDTEGTFVLPWDTPVQGNLLSGWLRGTAHPSAKCSAYGYNGALHVEERVYILFKFEASVEPSLGCSPYFMILT